MDKIYEFAIDEPLTAARRKGIGQEIKKNAHLSPKPLTFEWNEDTLLISAEPVKAEVRFHPKKVELFASAPFWARLLFTEKKKLQLKEQIEIGLRKGGFIKPKKGK
jgi:hypothetical protein